MLVEFDDGRTHEQNSEALRFLRTLVADTQTGRYSRSVPTFVLVSSSNANSQSEESLFESHYLEAGAVDTMRSPLCSEAIDRIVGHVKKVTRQPARYFASDMARNLIKGIASRDKPQIATHRPDELLSLQRRTAVEEAIAKWNFAAHEFDMDELAYAALIMLEHVLRNPALEQYGLARPQLMTFILAARRQYKHEREVHYHNWRHAVDVTQSLYCFLCDTRLCPPSDPDLAPKKELSALERLLTPFDALILIVSAVGHDVGHPGVNNAFLVASNNQLAHVYNDKSVLENYHCAAYSQLIRLHWSALGNISLFRSTMITTILATDMQRHFEYMGYLRDLKQKLDKSDPELADWKDKDREHARELVMALLIKAADISNVARPFEISAKWAKILMNEFSRQGELESELQIPTCLFGGPPDKEDALAAAQSQKGFMNLFGLPLFHGISEVMPNVSCTLPELEKNNDVWEKRIAEEKRRRDVKVERRASPPAFGSTIPEVDEDAQLRKRQSEPQVVPTIVPQTPTSPTRRQRVVETHGGVSRHPGAEQRQNATLGVSMGEQKRASTPVLWPSVLQLSPTGGSSRRSSKDVALNHMHEISAYAQQNMAAAAAVAAAGSRRGSADASWQMNQNYPGSRRGSKDDSLTTILVTSQGSPSSRGSPSSPGRSSKIESSSSGAAAAAAASTVVQRNSSTSKQLPGASQTSIPSSVSQTATSVATTTDIEASSTQQSSLMPADGGGSQIAERHVGSLDAGPGAWSLGNETSHSASEIPALPGTGTAAPEVLESFKSDSPEAMARVVSADSATSRPDTRKSVPQMRESRSRSRLRGLKFWKRRRGDTTGLESGESTP